MVHLKNYHSIHLLNWGKKKKRKKEKETPLTASNKIQGVSRLSGITAGGDFLGLCDQKFHINMCPILDG